MGVVVVFVGALVPDFDSAAVATFVLPNADALRVVAVSTKGRGAAGTNPFATTFVAFFLFFKALFKRLHQLVPTEFLNFCEFFRAELKL